MTNDQQIDLCVNGRNRTLKVDPRQLLVEVIRSSPDTLGTRVGCLTGDCGACTVMLNGRVVRSCLVLAASVSGSEIITIEGLTDIARLQSAFIRFNGFQCGYCTSGMLMVAADLLARNPHPSRQEIREALSGNLCRCTGYEDIVNSVYAAATEK